MRVPVALRVTVFVHVLGVCVRSLERLGGPRSEQVAMRTAVGVRVPVTAVTVGQRRRIHRLKRSAGGLPDCKLSGQDETKRKIARSVLHEAVMTNRCLRGMATLFP